MVDQEEFERINQLRLQAFRTNKSQDVENYYKAASSWFQGELDREIKRSHVSAAEITQLRAELEQERELADRLYSAIEYIDDYCLAYPELEAVSAVSSSAIDYVDTRRNK